MTPLLAPPAHVRLRYGTRRHRRSTVLAVGLLRAILLALRSDIVVSGRELHYGLLVSWLAARIARRPFSVIVQSRLDLAVDAYVSRRLRRPTLAALRGSDLLVCVSSGLVDSLVRLGLPRARIAIVANAIDPADVTAAAARESDVALPSAEVPTVIASGRLVPQKGFDLLLRAHALALRAGTPPYQLLVLGDGPARASLEELADELEVSESVAFLGHVANPHPLISRASVLVSSSRWEGFSLVLLEALAVSTPCIAFDCVSGPSEVLGDGAFGRLVPPEDVPALATAITDHLRDPAVLQEKAVRGTEPARDVFRPVEQAQLHRDLLHQILKSASSGTAVQPKLPSPGK